MRNHAPLAALPSLKRRSRAISCNPARRTILHTPDGRYIVVRGRLWRTANSALPPARRDALVRALMDARRAVGAAKRRGDRAAEARAHAAVDEAKIALGERGPVWWRDGKPDLNRHMARTTEYADWYAAAVAP